MNLRVPCVHGKWEACGRALARYTSNIESLNHSVTCPGGREPTVEEITQWLKEQGVNLLALGVRGVKTDDFR